MTANKNNAEAGRPAWAAGLDLSPELPRRLDDRLALDVKRWSESRSTLRRLADAEMRVAELEAKLETAVQVAVSNLITRGNQILREPDFLIDRHGDCWIRAESGGYAILGQGEVCARSAIEMCWGPVMEAWKS
jgi:hypothetical protein